MRVEVPKFADYSGVIQANQAMSNAFKQLGDTSQDYLDFSEKKKQNVVDNQYKQDVFNETKNQNNFSNQFRQNEFDYTKTRDGVKDGQYNQQFEYKQGRDLIDDGYKNKVFDYGVKRDGVKDSQWGQEFSYKQGQGNKPDYSTFNGVDAQGNPTLNMIDKNTGKVINTGQQVYQAPKEISPEQKLYYSDRSNEMQQKTLAATKKAFMENPAYSKMNEQDQLKAMQYIDANGKAPEIAFDDSWFGKGYYMPMSDAVQEVKKTNNTKKDGSTIDPFN